jgi:drug/metabolite transporter (DMT)-like permease
MIDPGKRHLGILYAGITAFLWGFLAIALKVAVSFIGPHSIVWIRFLIAFSILLIYFGFRNPDFLRIMVRPPLILLIAAVCLGFNYIGFMKGIDYTSPGNTQIIIQLGPILLAVVGVIVYKEKLTKKQMAGFLLAGTGFIVFYYNQLNGFLKDPEAFNIGVLYTVFGAVCWVIFAAFQKKLVQHWPAQQLNLVIYSIPLLMFFPYMDFQAAGNLKTWHWILLFFLGINTLIAYGSLTAAFKYLEANKVSIIITLNPIITFTVMIILDLLNVHWIIPEVINYYAFLGAILVLTGAVLAVGRPAKNNLKAIPEEKYKSN